jgi:hypothetical protein
MKLPRLYSLNNPAAPQWAVPELDESEIDALYQGIVSFVGYDPRSGSNRECVVIGSGVLVGIDETLIVISAAHIFSWWADRIMPPVRHALSVLQDDMEDLKNRVQQVVLNGYIKAFVIPREPHEGCICDITGLSFNPNPSDMDVAIAQLAIPTGVPVDKFRILPIDSDPFPFTEPVLIAGFTDGGRSLGAEENPFPRGLYELALTVRAGYVGGLVNKPDGFRSPMYRVNIPSAPGMSGGPMILFRPMSYMVEPQIVATTAGIISRSRIGTPFLLNHHEGGETWVCPIASALCRKVYRDGELHLLNEEVKRGAIPSYGRVARSVVWNPDPVTGHMIPNLEDSF